MHSEDSREERIEKLEAKPVNTSKRAAAMKLTTFVRGALAAGLVAALVAGQAIWDLESQRGEEMAHHAEAVNVTGRQRTLSQRLALLAHHADPSSGLDALRHVYETMRADAERISRYHGLWGHQLPALETAELARNQLWRQLDLFLLAEKADSATRTSALQALTREAIAFLVPMETAVAALQRSLEEREAELVDQRHKELVILFSALIIALWLTGELLLLKVRRDQRQLSRQASELSRLALVAQRTRNAVVLTDATGHITWVNDGFIELTGYSAAEALGKTPGSFLQCEATDPDAVARVRAAIRAGQAVTMNIVNRSKTGRLYWLLLDIQPVHAANGELLGFSGVNVDVTDQSERRDEAEAVHARLPVGVAVIDEQGLVAQANDRMRELLGLAAGMVFSDTAPEGLYPLQADDGQWLAPASYPVFVAWRGATGPSEVCVQTSSEASGLSSRRRWLIVHTAPYFAPLTRARRLIVTVTDITAERHQRELLDMAVRSAGIGIWDWDMRRQATTFAPHWWAILGLPASSEAVNSREWVQRVHPDDLVRAKQDLMAHVRDPRVAHRSEFRVRHADGHWVWVHSAGAIVETCTEGQPTRMVGMHIDISDRKRLEVTLREAARTDSLTQLPNRAALMSHLDACIARCIAKPSRRFAVLFLDFDRFKVVNDTLGHEAGDELLRMVAARLRNTVRGADDVARFDSLKSTAARVGGDEFVVLLQNLDAPSDAERVAQRLLHVLAQPYVVGGHSVSSTASMGIAYSGDSGLDPETLLRDADIAMYEAKRRGRNRAVWFSADMRLRISETQDLEADLRTALATTGQLSNAYQPIVNLHSRRAIGVEALARWMHPRKGPVSPVEFIPVAEESMLILQLGLVVLRQACVDFAGWRKTLGTQAPAYVSVNLSRAQLRSGTLLADVKAALAAAQLEPAVLRLEITESLAMQDETALAVLHQLRSAGVHLALDDFGTGYSSLASLDQFPIDMVKIDRSFVTRMVGDRYKAALVRSTAEVGAALDLIVVAEGIETEEQAAALVQQQCRFGQGYLFSRPLAAEPMALWLSLNLGRIETEPHSSGELVCQ